ncbi:MAG TPA: alanine/ornithine racemase family PLP-dependent enzyme [Candidatus Rifleibacterium sp.]|nr:alanine/ornithine racemase family PLP-dependent enzyme [Candidatus Rifleibacterium sp.]
MDNKSMIDYQTMKTTKFRTPRLEIYPERIQHNTRAIADQCHRAGVSLACVTKVTAAHAAVAAAMFAGGADMLADSRCENLWKLRQAGLPGPYLLLRLPALSRAAEVVEVADISLNSSLITIQALGQAAVQQQRTHKVIVMIDVGDLREGVWPDKAVQLIKDAALVKGIELIGMGCNLACYGGVIPSPANMKLLVDTVNACRKASGLPLPVVCGGNSSGLPIMNAGELPADVNLYRVGEAIVLGRNVIDRSPWQGTRQDTFIAVAEVIEAETKPSLPIGDRGQDAFGGSQDFIDRGLRRRVICNIGRQDVVVDGITPVDSGIIVLGGSSDHLILDVSDAAREFKVGDEIGFYPGYGALLALSTSEYVQKVVIAGK